MGEGLDLIRQEKRMQTNKIGRHWRTVANRSVQLRISTTCNYYQMNVILLRTEQKHRIQGNTLSESVSSIVFKTRRENRIHKELLKGDNLLIHGPCPIICM
jgi:hypothetical protein